MTESSPKHSGGSELVQQQGGLGNSRRRDGNDSAMSVTRQLPSSYPPSSRPQSREGSHASLYHTRSPTLPSATAPMMAVSTSTSSTFTTGILPNRAFMNPQRPGGASARAGARPGGGGDLTVQTHQHVQRQPPRNLSLSAASSRSKFDPSSSSHNIHIQSSSHLDFQPQPSPTRARQASEDNESLAATETSTAGVGSFGRHHFGSTSREPLIFSNGNDGRRSGGSREWQRNLPVGDSGEVEMRQTGSASTVRPEPGFASVFASSVTPNPSQIPSYPSSSAPSSTTPQHHPASSSHSPVFTPSSLTPIPPISSTSISPITSIPPRNQETSLSHARRKRSSQPQPSQKPTPPSSGVRAHALHPSSTTFFLDGRLMTGGDTHPWPFFLSIFFVLGIGALWIGTTGVYIWTKGVGNDGGGGGIAVVIIFVYIWLVAIGAMFATAFRDPGILPRNLDLHPQLVPNQSSDTLVPLPRDLPVRAGKVTVKYCETCRIYRPPRSSHCRICGNCVEGIDHHCTYLHTCIGRRNYTSFIAFLTFTFLALVYAIIWSALHLYFLTFRTSPNGGRSLGGALRTDAGSGVVFVLGLLLLGPLAALWGYHIQLMLTHTTTIEAIRRTAARKLVKSSSSSQPLSSTSRFAFWRARSSPASHNEEAPPLNPFRFGRWTTNFGRMLCRPVTPAWGDWRRVLSEEDAKEVRRIMEGREEGD